jgi:NAD(P)-dependent dehydrogenase (short-subunit alcohol dehydrogenase family)
VNAVCPGTIDTPFARAAFEDEKKFEAFSKSLPIGRIGKPEEIASVVLWLCSPGASYVVWHALVVDGGQTRWAPVRGRNYAITAGRPQRDSQG